MSDLTLILNAAEHRMHIGLAQEDVLLCGQDWLAASRGAELLAPALADLMRRLGVETSAISRLACVHGPGGFTGLRLALSTASAMHHALNIPLAPLSYLDVLAESAESGPGERIRVLVNARRDLAFQQDFLRHPDTCSPAAPPEVLSVESALLQLERAADNPDVLIGSAVTRHFMTFASRCTGPRICRNDQPTWQALVRVAARAVYGFEDLTPMYLRASEAEDNLEVLAERRGDDPVAARDALRQLLTREPGSVL